jgi:PAS domain S-box-containing protein
VSVPPVIASIPNTADLDASAADLALAHRAHLAQRFPTLVLLNMSATVVWLVTLCAAGNITPGAALVTFASQLLILMPAAAACRRRPTGWWVIPIAVAAFASVGLSWVGLAIASTGSGVILGFIMFSLFVGVGIGTAWGLGPQLALQAIVGTAWTAALPFILTRLSVSERVVVGGFGALISLLIADWAGRTFRVHERRHRAEARLAAELAASRDAFRDLYEHARDFIWIADLKGRLIYVNAALARVYDRPAASFRDLTVADLLTDHPDNPQPPEWKIGMALVRTGERLPTRVVQARTTPTPRWVETMISPMRDAGGDITGMQAICRDVTKRREAEEALRVSEARYRGLVESQSEVVCRFDREARFTFVNDACCALYDVCREELLGKDFWPLVHPEDEGLRAAVASVWAPPYRASIENRTRAKVGWRWFEWDASGITDASGAVVEVQIAGRDVTERRAVADQLRSSLDELRASQEKLRLLAQRQVEIREQERTRLGFDLHDDVCQELVGIGILAESVRSRLGPIPSEAATDLQRIARYLNEVVEHVRLLARDLRPMLLHDLGLEESLRALAVGLLSPETQVTASFSTHVPRLEQSAEVTVYRIAQEALTNATRHAHARTIALTLQTTDHALALEVRDDGCGFDPKHRRGQALGLLSMEERALALGGRLDVRSTPGRGTVIRLECPLARRSPKSAA